MRKLLTIAMVLGLGGAAVADTFRSCEINSGRVYRCGKRVSGSAVSYETGAWRTCEFVNGRLARCGKKFSGMIGLNIDGEFRECEINAGRRVRCSRRFSGTAVLISD